ncbi:MAG: hypothetical protein QM784_25085 [Polyangiaceae bacterium]
MNEDCERAEADDGNPERCLWESKHLPCGRQPSFVTTNQPKRQQDLGDHDYQVGEDFAHAWASSGILGLGLAGTVGLELAGRGRRCALGTAVSRSARALYSRFLGWVANTSAKRRCDGPPSSDTARSRASDERHGSRPPARFVRQRTVVPADALGGRDDVASVLTPDDASAGGVTEAKSSRNARSETGLGGAAEIPTARPVLAAH